MIRFVKKVPSSVTSGLQNMIYDRIFVENSHWALIGNLWSTFNMYDRTLFSAIGERGRGGPKGMSTLNS